MYAKLSIYLEYFLGVRAERLGGLAWRRRWPRHSFSPAALGLRQHVWHPPLFMSQHQLPPTHINLAPHEESGVFRSGPHFLREACLFMADRDADANAMSR